MRHVTADIGSLTMLNWVYSIALASASPLDVARRPGHRRDTWTESTLRRSLSPAKSKPSLSPQSPSRSPSGGLCASVYSRPNSGSHHQVRVRHPLLSEKECHSAEKTARSQILKAKRTAERGVNRHQEQPNQARVRNLQRRAVGRQHLVCWPWERWKLMWIWVMGRSNQRSRVRDGLPIVCRQGNYGMRKIPVV